MKDCGWKIVRFATVLILMLFAVIPIYWMVLVAFNPAGLTLNWPPLLYPKIGELSLDGFRNAQGPTLAWLSNSIRLAVFCSLATLIVSTPAGYVLARARGAEVTTVGVLMIVSKMVPGSLLIVPLYIMFRQSGLLYTDLAVVLANLSYTIPFATWLMAVYIRSIPREIEEAGTIDGGSSTWVFFHITLPLAGPAVAAIALYSFVIAWNDYIFARTFLPLGDKTTISVGATTLIGDFILEWNSVMAVAVLATLPVLVVFLSLQRFFVAGLVQGHDK